jgi:hypothetical protein
MSADTGTLTFAIGWPGSATAASAGEIAQL